MTPSNVDRVGRLDGQDGGLRYFVLDKAKSAVFSCCCIDLERQFLDGTESTESLADVILCRFKGDRSDIDPAEGLSLLRDVGDGERWFRFCR